MITRSKILLFAVAGALSGVVSALCQYILPDIPWIQQHYPPVILGITLYLCGVFLAGIQNRKPLLSLTALIIFSILGWRISIDVGYALGGPAPYVTAGALGAFVVAWGWLLAWGMPVRDWKFILIVVLAGTLGGLIFHIADLVWKLPDPYWALLLFTEWQCLLLTGIAVAQQDLKKQKN
jgi:hypothetical protein